MSEPMETEASDSDDFTQSDSGGCDDIPEKAQMQLGCGDRLSVSTGSEVQMTNAGKWETFNGSIETPDVEQMKPNSDDGELDSRCIGNADGYNDVNMNDAAKDESKHAEFQETSQSSKSDSGAPRQNNDSVFSSSAAYVQRQQQQQHQEGTNCQLSKKKKKLKCPVYRKHHKADVIKRVFNVPLFQCKTCKQYFASRLRHAHHAEKSVSACQGNVRKNAMVCLLCGRRFSSKRSCADHVLGHRRMTRGCERCGWMFCSAFSLHAHNVLWHWGHASPPPSRRGSTDSEVSVGVEFEQPNTEDLKYACPLAKCSDIFNSAAEAASHVTIQHLAVKFCCRLCARPFKSAELRQKHEDNHFRMIYMCDWLHCGFTYEDFPGLQKHAHGRHQHKISIQDASRHLLSEVLNRVSSFISSSTDQKDAQDGLAAANSSGTNRVSTPKSNHRGPGQPCSICSRVFQTIPSRREHEDSHHLAVHICPESGCGWAFNTSGGLKLHVHKSHSPTAELKKQQSLASQPEKRLSCNVCSRVFKKETIRMEHEENHHLAVYQCPEQTCSWRFQDFTKLQLHIYQKHPGTSVLKSNHTQFLVKGEDASGETGKQLPQDEKVPPAEELVVPAKGEEENDNNRRTCEKCGRVFKTAERRQEHENMHDLVSYQCPGPDCGWQFEGLAAMQAHAKYKHAISIAAADANQYLINRNDNANATADENNHGEVNGAQSTAAVDDRICTLCSRRFLKPQARTRHEEDHHLMVHLCPVSECSLVFESLQHLQAHTMKHGFSVKKKDYWCDPAAVARVTCQLCARVFGNEELLREHEQSHEHDLQHRCTEPGCTGAFETWAALNRHRISTHHRPAAGSFQHSVLTNDTPTSGISSGDVAPVGDAIHTASSDSSNDTPASGISSGDVPPVGNAINTASSDPSVTESKCTEKPGFPCQLCGRPFKSSHNLRMHEDNHDNMRYMCREGCGFTFDEMQHLRSHYRSYHKMNISSRDESLYITQNRHLDNNQPNENEQKPKKSLSSQEHSVSKHHVYAINQRSCPRCGRYFAKVSSRRDHIHNHHEMKFVCPEVGCGWAYQTFSLLQSHGLLMHAKRRFRQEECLASDKNDTSCALCRRQFPTAKETNRHMADHDKMRFVCLHPECGWTFKSLNSLKEHSSENHGVIIPKEKEDKHVTSGTERVELICQSCNRPLSTFEKLKKHEESHDSLNFRCREPFCGWMYESYHVLKGHYRSTHKTKLKNDQMQEFLVPGKIQRDDQTCPLCERKFRAVRACEEHVANHDNMRYVCPFPRCAWMFESFETLQLHRYSRHSRRELCSNKEHEFAIPGKEQTKFACKICSRWFTAKDVLSRHEANHGNMMYQCQEPDCGWMFEKYEFLRAHSVSRHKTKISSNPLPEFELPGQRKGQVEEKAHNRCPICGRKLGNKQVFDWHVENHEKMIYKCPNSSCGTLWETIGQLRSHCKQKHGLEIARDQEQSYLLPGKRDDLKCHICNRRFTKSFGLQQHIENHDKMRYVCREQDCTNMFEMFHELKTHCRANHTLDLADDEKEFLIRRDTAFEPLAETVCKICRRRFKDSQKLRKHWEKHDDMAYICAHPECGWMFQHFSGLQKHCSTRHNAQLSQQDVQKYLIPGKESKRVSSSEGELEKPRPSSQGKKQKKMGGKTHLSPKKVLYQNVPTCKKCNRQFFNREHHDSLRYKCEVCGWMFKKSTQIEEHEVAKHNINATDKKQLPMVCSRCHREFQWSELHKLHMKMHQHHKLKYKCQSCGWMYQKFSLLRSHYAKSHAMTVTEDNESQYRVDRKNTQGRGSRTPRTCSQCDRVFPTQEATQAHVQNHEKMQFACKVCGWRFEYFPEMQAHCQRKHSIQVRGEDEDRYRIKPPSTAASNSTAVPDQSRQQKRLNNGNSSAPPAIEQKKPSQPTLDKFVNAAQVRYKCLCTPPLVFKDPKALQEHNAVVAHRTTANPNAASVVVLPTVTVALPNQGGISPSAKLQPTGGHSTAQAQAMNLLLALNAAKGKQQQGQVSASPRIVVKPPAQASAATKTSDKEVPMDLPYICHRCKIYFATFNDTQNHYFQKHNTELSVEDEGLCRRERVKSAPVVSPSLPVVTKVVSAQTPKNVAGNTTPKRRGRPRKNPSVPTAVSNAAVKRGPGRPRKKKFLQTTEVADEGPPIKKFRLDGIHAENGTVTIVPQSATSNTQTSEQTNI